MRPREKLLRSGPQSLTEAELLALIIRSGTAKKDVMAMSRGLLSRKGLEGVASLSTQSIIDHHSMGTAAAASVVAACELARRVQHGHDAACIIDVAGATQQFDFIRLKRREYFVGVYLNARSEVIKRFIISIGTLDASIVHPREVLAPALELRAARVLIGHNHPSGNIEPSHEDIQLTKRLIKAGELLDIPIMDHIIVSKQGAFSFMENDLIMNKGP